MYLSRQPGGAGTLPAAGRAANYATLRSFSFSLPSPQLHKANPAAETSASRWHHLLSEEIVCKAALKSCALLRRDCTELPCAQGQPVALPLCSGGCQALLLWDTEELLAIASYFAPYFFLSFLIRLGNGSCWLQHLTGLGVRSCPQVTPKSKMQSVCVHVCVHVCVYFGRELRKRFSRCKPAPTPNGF